MQQSTNNNTKFKGLTITKGVKQKLTKNQEAFNKLTQRIEKLQKEIEKKGLQYDMALKIYSTDLYPAQLKVLEGRQKLIIALWDIYKSKRLSKTDQRHLKWIIQHNFQEFFGESDNELPEELKRIFSEIEGINYDKLLKEEKEASFADLQEAFKKLKVDMTGINMEDSEAIAAKIAEAKQKMFEEEEQKGEQKKIKADNKKKSIRQVESEKMQKAVEEMKQKNISTIYRQLAKLFHPDLEQDPERKLEKEVLMKSLIAAYEAKNLHALLSLELKWIHKETDHLESLTEEKLAVYLQILREQASSLEHEKHAILNQPQYYVLRNIEGYGIRKFPVDTLHNLVISAKNSIRIFKKDISNLEGPKALNYVKELIKSFKKMDEEQFIDEDIIRLLFE